MLSGVIIWALDGNPEHLQGTPGKDFSLSMPQSSPLENGPLGKSCSSRGGATELWPSEHELLLPNKATRTDVVGGNSSAAMAQ